MHTHCVRERAGTSGTVTPHRPATVGVRVPDQPPPQGPLADTPRRPHGRLAAKRNGPPAEPRLPVVSSVDTSAGGGAARASVVCVCVWGGVWVGVAEGEARQAVPPAGRRWPLVGGGRPRRRRPPSPGGVSLARGPGRLSPDLYFQCRPRLWQWTGKGRHSSSRRCRSTQTAVPLWSVVWCRVPVRTTRKSTPSTMTRPRPRATDARLSYSAVAQTRRERPRGVTESARPPPPVPSRALQTESSGAGGVGGRAMTHSAWCSLPSLAAASHGPLGAAPAADPFALAGRASKRGWPARMLRDPSRGTGGVSAPPRPVRVE